MSDIFDQHGNRPVGICDKFYLLGVLIFFHRNRDFDAGVRRQVLLLELLDVYKRQMKI